MSAEGWVYTINHESRHLIIENIPSYGVIDELVDLCGIHGEIEEYRLLNTYPSAQFTQAYLISYKNIQDARISKRRLNGHNFFSQLLHTRYAPEFETIQDTQLKLALRRRHIGKTGDPDAKQTHLPGQHQQPMSYQAPHPVQRQSRQSPVTTTLLIHPASPAHTTLAQAPQIMPSLYPTVSAVTASHTTPIQKKRRRI